MTDAERPLSAGRVGRPHGLDGSFHATGPRTRLLREGVRVLLAGDLVGCSVPGLGSVSRVLDGPTCALLELDDGTLVPLVGDAVSRVDVEARVIEVDREFLSP